MPAQTRFKGKKRPDVGQHKPKRAEKPPKAPPNASYSQPITAQENIAVQGLMSIAIDRNRRGKMPEADNLRYADVRAAIPPQDAPEEGPEDEADRAATMDIDEEIEVESDDKKDNEARIESEARIEIDLDDITSQTPARKDFDTSPVYSYTYQVIISPKIVVWSKSDFVDHS